MNRKFNRWRTLILYALLIVAVFAVVNMTGSTPRDVVAQISYTDLMTLIENDQLSMVVVTGTTLRALTADSAIPAVEFPTRYNIQSELTTSTQFFADVKAIYARRLGVDAESVVTNDYAFRLYVDQPEGASWWVEWLPLIISMLLFVALWFFIMRQQAGAGKGGVMNFGRSRARLIDPNAVKVTFKDVAGAEEEKEELREIVEFLKNPKRFTDLGARIPKGVLLVGPPGTGKTLLAKAVSGEAGVPFFTISGSDFVEMFVGVGASRVRDLFEQAKKASPAIVFIDEIDAVGRQRGAGLGGGHDEREQTLNQLLVEMDGFTHNMGVIVIAATNRSDILDPALLRPGRFDRQIVVNYPDVKGREEIMKVHSRGKPLAKDVKLDVLAKRTPFFTGADLENVMNEAAILSARSGHTSISMATVEEAITKVSAGPEKKSYRVTDADKRLVAYHEAGHAIVMHFIPECDRVHEISIIPRGRGAGGYTMFLPDEETHYISSKRLMARITGMLGGHCCEKLIMGDVSTGSTSDLKQATKLARDMVTEYGMSSRVGPIFLGGEHEVFLGRDFSQSRSSFSEAVNSEIDGEVRGILGECYDRAMSILEDHRDALDRLADALLEKEKVDEAEFNAIISGMALESPAKAPDVNKEAPDNGEAAQDNDDANGEAAASGDEAVEAETNADENAGDKGEQARG
ncbi:MAG: ATP-dependent zinc metalloprotease FtsH [Clostridia bacterium]|nr:ATP-dependent zinc metalloprotease FtsH [Clostridia bacterium]